MKNIGGQAVVEGVMMKSDKAWTVAVRDSKGVIHIKNEKLARLPKALKLPMIRGVISLFYALFLGVKAIEFSASKAYDEGEGSISAPMIILTIIFAFAVGVLLFIFLPLYITKLTGIVFNPVSNNSFVFNLVDGIFRVIIFLLYIFAVRLWKEMRRIFEYHGAEHKVIHAYEADKELTEDNIKKFSTCHPRCGTSFLLIVMIVSIIVFSFIPQAWSFADKFLSRIVLIPLIAGVSYELLKLSARMKNNPVINFLTMPGMFLQRLTTSEPDEKQMEVAAIALKEVLKFGEENV